MEELKELVSLLDRLPNLALWVIAAFWAYKVVVIGSVYGVIRFAIDKVHSWLTTRKHTLVEVDLVLDGQVITGTKEQLLRQLARIKGRGVQIKTEYVHGADIEWLRAAIDEKLEREQSQERRAA